MKYIVLTFLFAALISTKGFADSCPPIVLIKNAHLSQAMQPEVDYPGWAFFSDPFSYGNQQWNTGTLSIIHIVENANDALKKAQEILKKTKFIEPTYQTDGELTACIYHADYSDLDENELDQQDLIGMVFAFSPPTMNLNALPQE